MPKVDKEMAEDLAKQVADAAAGNNNVDANETGQETGQQATDTDTGSVEDTGGDASADSGQSSSQDSQPTGIPKSRFDAVNDRRKAAETKAADLQRQLDEARVALPAGTPMASTTIARPAEITADEQLVTQQLKDASRKHATALSEGDVDAAVEAQMAVTDLNSKLLSIRNPVVQQDMGSTVEEVDYQHELRALKGTHPQLNEFAPEYDEAMVIEVNELYKGFVATGKSKGEAIRRASEYVIPAAGTGTSGPNAADTRRNADNAANNAPNIGGAGNVSGDGGEGKINWGALSDADYDAMPESKKKEARGDFLT